MCVGVLWCFFFGNVFSLFRKNSTGNSKENIVTVLRKKKLQRPFFSVAGQRPVCIRGVQTAAGGVEEPRPQGPGRSADP